ncbi:L-aspartate oxidase [Nocardioides sp. Root190]|uniref:oxygenase MpaB family protein n=1 Tax=Nocardioides sp. Root190 TaxID=1736488 RepID=UPI0006F76060|nr:oxygenase MpaB family protein [Nocardioides sp. Root190]KRB80330.1 L-aspartate oxidase [Nocardioides sp. Root190]
MAKTLWRDRNDALDPETDYVEIYQNLALYEFTWDFTQSLSFALFRTYAVPSIGRLLYETGAFTGQVQKRYDDTALLLEAPFVHGLDSDAGKTAIRRINQMHRAYDISNEDFLYVLATFVVVPKRWLDDHGWRQLTDNELRATVNYYRALGRRMAIKDIPETYDEFMHLMDDYERAHFDFDAGGRQVADSTLALMTTFYPRVLRKPVALFSRALMDKPLLDAFAYVEPPAVVRRASLLAMRLRARALRHTPSPRRPTFIADLPRVKSYPHGYALGALGTLPTPGVAGCPVRHTADA